MSNWKSLILGRSLVSVYVYVYADTNKYCQKKQDHVKLLIPVCLSFLRGFF